MLILIIFLLVVAAISNSVMDTIKFRYDDSIFNSYWFAPDSWKLKWKYIDDKRIKIEKSPWYYFGFKLEYQEKFPYSSTIFVWVTNAWHFFQFLMFTSLQLIITVLLFQLYTFTLLEIIGVFLLIKTIFNLIFELFWSYILIK